MCLVGLVCVKYPSKENVMQPPIRLQLVNGTTLLLACSLKQNGQIFVSIVYVD